MANYYIYDPNVPLSLGQALQLANASPGKDYVISAAANTLLKYNDFLALKTPTAGDPGSAGILQRDLATTPGFGIIHNFLNQAVQDGGETPNFNPDDKIHIINKAQHPNVESNLFYGGQWKDVTNFMRSVQDTAIPNWRYGGWIEDDVYLDLTAFRHGVDHTFPGEVRIFPDLTKNRGNWGNRQGDDHGGSHAIAHSNDAPIRGLAINKGNVTIRNFAAVTDAFGEDRTPYNLDNSGIPLDKFAAPAVALDIRGANVSFRGDFGIDTLTQTRDSDRFNMLKAPIMITNGGTATFEENTRVVLGAVRGYDSIIHVDAGSTLNLRKNKTYALSTSNSDKDWPKGNATGLSGWDDFSNALAASQILKASNGGIINIENALFTVENGPTEKGKTFDLTSENNVLDTWTGNDFGSYNGGIYIEGGTLNISNDSKVFSGIAVSAGRVNIDNSVIAGRDEFNKKNAISLRSNSYLGLGKNTMVDAVLINSNSWNVVGDSDPTNAILESNSDKIKTYGKTVLGDTFAGITELQELEIAAYGGNGDDNVKFQFRGPKELSNLKITANAQQSGPLVALSQKLLAASPQGITYEVTATFSAPGVTGFDSADVLQALQSAPGWSLASGSQPRSSDGGLTWTFQLSAAANSKDLVFALSRGVAQSLGTPSQDSQASSNQLTLKGLPVSVASNNNSAHIVNHVASFGAILTDQNVQTDQTIEITTDHLDGKALILTINGKTYFASVSSNKATFTLPAVDLQQLPYGSDQFTVSVNGDPGVAPLNRTFSRGHGQTGTGSGSQAPIVSSITPSFGSTVSQTQQGSHSVAVQTSGLPQGTQLGLQINGQTVTTAGGGTVGSNGQSIFTLPAAVIQALSSGLSHQISVTGTTSSGVAVGSVQKSFTPLNSNAVNNPLVYPHIDSVAATFGSILEEQEKNAEQQISVNTTGFSDGDTLNLELAGKRYVSTVANGAATFTLPKIDLESLQSGSTPRIVLTGTNSVGNQAPEHDFLFAVDGAVSNIHITDIIPSFGSALDGKEATQDQTILVRTEGLSDGGKISLSLNNKTYSTTISNNAARFAIKSTDLKQLPLGADRILVSSGGSNSIRSELAFTVLESDASINASTTGIRLRGNAKKNSYKGTILRDRISGHKKDDSIIGLDGSDHLSGGKGRDQIDGGPGNDFIYGGAGGDILTGGEGSDVFYYKSLKDSKASNAKHLDTITDFEPIDFLNLARIYKGLSYIGEDPFTGQPGELRFAQSILGADLNGDKKADFYIDINTPILYEEQLIL